MMEAVRTSETSVDNHFTRQYIPEDNSEHHDACNVVYRLVVDVSAELSQNIFSMLKIRSIRVA
jgi:hypothetical protein